MLLQEMKKKEYFNSIGSGIEIEFAVKEKREPDLLPMITPHILRHMACTRMAEAGVDIKVLQTVMGHKKADVTMNIYNHVDLHGIRKEFEKVDFSEDEV